MQPLFLHQQKTAYPMKILVTGATGYIGMRICEALAAQGHEVHALYRSERKAAPLKGHPGIQLFKGDVRERSSIRKAVKGTDAVIHVAAFAKPWAPDRQLFFRINVEGARIVFEEAHRADVGRVVFTSTAGTINPSVNGRLSDEFTPRHLPHFTDYEASKAEAEKLASQMSRQTGMAIVIVNPTRVYGPGMLSDSNGVTRMVKLYLEGKFRFIPGDGSSVGNYVYIDDVVAGHLAALHRGRGGERYILGGENASFNEFFEILAEVTGLRYRMIKLPLSVMKLVAHAMHLQAEWFGKPPLITPPWVEKYLYNWSLSTQRMKEELGVHPLSLREGLHHTVAWLQEKDGGSQRPPTASYLPRPRAPEPA